MQKFADLPAFWKWLTVVVALMLLAFLAQALGVDIPVIPGGPTDPSPSPSVTVPASPSPVPTLEPSPSVTPVA